MAGADPRPPSRIGWLEELFRRKDWLRRGVIVHRYGVQIDLEALPGDAATLQQMLRAVLLEQSDLHAENDKLRLLIRQQRCPPQIHKRYLVDPCCPFRHQITGTRPTARCRRRNAYNPGAGHDRGQARRCRSARGARHRRRAADAGAAGNACIGVWCMISIPAGVRLLLATRPVDFRKGAHGLAAVAAAQLREDRFSGVVIVYRAKRADRVKLLVWDGSGLVLVGSSCSRAPSSGHLLQMG